MTFPDIMLAIHFFFFFFFLSCMGHAKHIAVKLTRAVEGASNKNVRCASLRDTGSSSREKVGPQ